MDDPSADAVRTTAYNLALRARDLIALVTIDDPDPGAMIEASRLLRADALIVQHAAVRAECNRGMTWPAIAARLRLNEIDTRRRYGGKAVQHLGGVPAAVILDWYIRSAPAALDTTEGPGEPDPSTTA